MNDHFFVDLTKADLVKKNKLLLPLIYFQKASLFPNFWFKSQ
jgi:hypothetical protein